MTTTPERAPRAPLFDPWVRAAHLTTLRAACDARDAVGILDALRATTSPDELSFLMELVASVDGVEGCLEEAVGRDGSDPLARTVLARRYVTVGWGIRTRERAQYVSAEQFAQFHDWLRRAERLLMDVCADDPGYAPAWEVRLTTARGLELGQSEARRRYDRAVAAAGAYSAVQSVYLQQIVPKWGGSWETAEAFVAACVAQAGPGSLSHRLVAELECERMIDDDNVVARLLDPAVVARLQEAATASVWHPAHVPSPGTAVAHSLFAFVFTVASRAADAAPHFRAAGDHPDDAGWKHHAAPEAYYRRERALALGEATVPLLPGEPGRGPEGIPSRVTLLVMYLILWPAAAFLAIGAVVGDAEASVAEAWLTRIVFFLLALCTLALPVWAHLRARRLMRKAGLR